MKEEIIFDLTKKEKETIMELLSIWREKKFKGGEIKIIFHNFEPQDIVYKQQKRLGA